MLARSISSEYLGSFGHRFSGRRFYIRRHRDDFLLLDAAILPRRSFKYPPDKRRPIWVGDLNVTEKREELKALQRTLGEKLYCYREHDTLSIVDHPPYARQCYVFYISATGIHRGEYDAASMDGL